MLDLYINIKKRRIELGISQQELADKVGYKGKSMISQVENGNVDLSLSMIEQFAKALKCTPSYLMGWDTPDKSLSNEIDYSNLDDRTKAFLDLYLSADSDARKTVEIFLESSQHRS